MRKCACGKNAIGYFDRTYHLEDRPIEVHVTFKTRTWDYTTVGICYNCILRLVLGYCEKELGLVEDHEQ